jgi:hypothetical protein
MHFPVRITPTYRPCRPFVAVSEGKPVQFIVEDAKMLRETPIVIFRGERHG